MREEALTESKKIKEKGVRANDDDVRTDRKEHNGGNTITGDRFIKKC